MTTIFQIIRASFLAEVFKATVDFFRTVSLSVSVKTQDAVENFSLGLSDKFSFLFSKMFQFGVFQIKCRVGTPAREGYCQNYIFHLYSFSLPASFFINKILLPDSNSCKLRTAVFYYLNISTLFLFEHSKNIRVFLCHNYFFNLFSNHVL